MDIEEELKATPAPDDPPVLVKTRQAALTTEQNKIQTEIKKFNVLDQKRYLKDFNSYNYLIDSKDYLEKIFKCNIEIFKGDNENIYDPEERSKFAVPLRPAIYIQ